MMMMMKRRERIREERWMGEKRVCLVDGSVGVRVECVEERVEVLVRRRRRMRREEVQIDGISQTMGDGKVVIPLIR